MKKAIFAATMLAAALGTLVFTHAAQKGPKFAEYAVPAYGGKKAPIRMDTVHPINASRIRPYLEQAYAGPVNFAGHYVFVVLEAGPDCETGAAIDVRTGQVHELSVAACHWRENDTAPFHIRPDSRLLVLSGSVGMEGTRGAHYYVLDKGQFLPLDDATSRNVLTEKLFGKEQNEPMDDQELAFQLGKQGMEYLDRTESDEASGEEIEAAVTTDLPIHERPEGRKALSRAFAFAMYRPLLKRDWMKARNDISMDKIDYIANLFIKTAAVYEVKTNDGEAVLLFNPSFDLFAIVGKMQSGDVFYGLSPVSTFSEKVLGIQYGENYIDNMTNYRPRILKEAVAELKGNFESIRGIFDLYKVDERASVEVFDHIRAFIQFVRDDSRDECRKIVEDKVRNEKFSFPDGRESKEIGEIYSTTVVPVAMSEGKKLRNALAFFDKKTSKSGGYALFDPFNNCIVDVIVPVSF